MNAKEFTSVYNDHEKLVSSEVYARLHNKEDVADVCQDVWLNAWRSRETYDSKKAKLSTWLVAIAAQSVDRHLRNSIEKSPEIVLDSSLTPVIDGEVSEGSWIEQMVPSQSTAEDEQLLSELMFRAASLSEQEAAVFNLVYWHGKSYAATAAQLGISPDTIGPMVGRIREKLEVKELYHKAYTYHGGGSVWADWSFKHLPPGQCVQRLDLIDKYNEFAPDVGCSETELRTAIRKGTDAILKQESNKNGITTSNWFDSAGFEQTL